MKKKITAIVSIIIAISLCLAIALPAIFGAFAFADEVEDKKEQLEQGEAQEQEIKEKLDDAKKERRSKENEKKKLDDEISELNSEIYALNQTIEANDAKIAEKQDEITAVEAEIKESDELLKMRLRVMYEKGTTSYIDILFGAASFSDLLVRVDMVTQLITHDKALIAQLNEKKDKIQAAKEEIEAKNKDNESAKATILGQKKKLDAKSAESDRLIAELRADEEYLQEEYEKRVAENKRILAEIKAKIGDNQISAYSGGQLGWPSTQRGTITSEFGARTLRGKPDNHTGIDIAVPTGTPVLAAEDGVVLVSGWSKSGYGNYVTINHGSITTLYAHNSVLLVHAGQKVSKGEKIALAGSTGNSTGPHIHFGVIDNSTGKYTNPRPYIF